MPQRTPSFDQLETRRLLSEAYWDPAYGWYPDYGTMPTTPAQVSPNPVDQLIPAPILQPHPPAVTVPFYPMPIDHPPRYEPLSDDPYTNN